MSTGEEAGAETTGATGKVHYFAITDDTAHADLARDAVASGLPDESYLDIRLEMDTSTDRDRWEEFIAVAAKTGYRSVRRLKLAADVVCADGDQFTRDDSRTLPRIDWEAVLRHDSAARRSWIGPVLTELGEFIDNARTNTGLMIPIRYLAKLSRWLLAAVPIRRLRRTTMISLHGRPANLLEDMLGLRGNHRRATAAHETVAARTVVDTEALTETRRQIATIDGQIAERYFQALRADLTETGAGIVFPGVRDNDRSGDLAALIRAGIAGLAARERDRLYDLDADTDTADPHRRRLPRQLLRNLKPFRWIAILPVGGRTGRRNSKLVLGGVTALVVALLIGLFVPFGQSSFFWRFWNGCAGDGVWPSVANADECVGVTDGAFTFSPKYAGVFDKIKAENDRVTDSGNEYISIAVLVPYTIGPGDSNTEDSLLGQLEGAYIAAHQANTKTSGVEEPQIRLLLANIGSEGGQWRPVADELAARMSSPDDRLAAVVGLGSSFGNTAKAIAALGAAGLPMVASVATADDLLDASPRAFRVAPTNSDESTAMAKYLLDDSDIDTAMLVKDLDPANLYARTLSESFTETFGADRITDFSYHARAEGSVPEFRTAVSQLCEDRPDVVMFAGRAKRDLHDFLLTLSERKCGNTDVRVIAGDDASHLPDDEDLAWSLAGSGTTLEYAGLGHPSEWDIDTAPERDTHGDMAWFRHRMEQEFPGSHLDDGQAIMSFDSVLVTVDAARRTGEKVPDAEDVYDKLLRTSECDMVLGLSGPIAFTDDRNPDNKTIPILRTDWETGVEVVGMTWPRGRISDRPGECS